MSADIAKVIDKTIADSEKAQRKAIDDAKKLQDKAESEAIAGFDKMGAEIAKVQHNRIMLLAQIQKQQSQQQAQQHAQQVAEAHELAQKQAEGWARARDGALEAAQAAVLYGLSGSKSASDVLNGLLKMSAAVKSLGLINLYKGLAQAGMVPDISGMAASAAAHPARAAWLAADAMGLSLGGAATVGAGGAAIAAAGLAGAAAYNLWNSERAPSLSPNDPRLIKQQNQTAFAGGRSAIGAGVHALAYSAYGGPAADHRAKELGTQLAAIQGRLSAAGFTGDRNDQIAEERRAAEEHIATMREMGVSTMFTAGGTGNSSQRRAQDAELAFRRRDAITGRLRAQRVIDTGGYQEQGVAPHDAVMRAAEQDAAPRRKLRATKSSGSSWRYSGFGPTRTAPASSCLGYATSCNCASR